MDDDKYDEWVQNHYDELVSQYIDEHDSDFEKFVFDQFEVAQQDDGDAEYERQRDLRL